MFGAQLRELQSAGEQLAPTFSFIDPFGYTQTTMHLTGQFFEFKRSEALIYLPLPFISRFVGREGQERGLTALFGCEDWRDAIPLDEEGRGLFLHDLFRDQLRAAGSRYVRSFEIRSGHKHGYHLFFATSHERGLEKMKDAMWLLDPIQGQRYSDSTNPAQLILFGDTVDAAALMQDLMNEFGYRRFTIEEAESFTIRDTAFRKAHLKRQTLAQAEADGQLRVLTPRRRAYTYPPRTRMRFER